MTVTVVTPPAAIVTPTEAAKYLRVDFADDNEMIAAMVAAATSYLDGPNGILGRAIGTQTLLLTQESFLDADGYSEITLSHPPIISITTVKYYDSADVLTTIAAEDYRFVGGVLMPAYGGSWPTPRSDDVAAVEITYQAGYSTVPSSLKQAVLQHVAAMYANREAATNPALTPVPFGYEDLIRPFHVWAL